MRTHPRSRAMLERVSCLEGGGRVCGGKFEGESVTVGESEIGVRFDDSMESSDNCI